MPYLGIFWIELKKNCCHILNQHIQISLILKFCDKKKTKKKNEYVLNQNTLFGYFWA